MAPLFKVNLSSKEKPQAEKLIDLPLLDASKANPLTFSSQTNLKTDQDLKEMLEWHSGPYHFASLNRKMER